MFLNKSVEVALDRFRKVRVGQLTSDIDSNGEVDVQWLDGEPGGQGKIQISYLAFDNTASSPWGLEVGFGRGMVGIFGFLQDNHAILLTTIVSKIKDRGVGYDKTEKIKTGEFRFTSKAGAQIFWDLAGNLLLKSGATSISIDKATSAVHVTATGGFFVNGTQVP